MGKSVYSLVLGDEVIAAADRVAYQKNMSRSALINQILAEALSCVTPERRNRSVFDAVEKWMQTSGFRLQMMPSESVLSIHSALSYKYNPRIRYAVELYLSLIHIFIFCSSAHHFKKGVLCSSGVRSPAAGAHRPCLLYTSYHNIEKRKFA